MRLSIFVFISFLLIFSNEIMGQYQRIDIPTKQILRDVHFFDENRGVVIADSGLILGTYDGGQSWQKEYINPINDNFHRLLFPKDSTGYLFGRNGNIWKTTDLGSTWAWISQVDTIGFYTFDAQFVTPDIGYAANYFNIYRTDDGGYSWNPLSFPEDYVAYLYFITHDSGKATFANTLDVMSTNDGGASWAKDSLQRQHSEWWSSNKLFLTGTRGFLFCSGGNPGPLCDVYQFEPSSGIWKVNPNFPFVVGEAYDITFPSDSIGYVAGYFENNNSNIILKTTDFGVSWGLQILPDSLGVVFGVHFVNDSVGYLVGYNSIYKTINGGGAIMSITDDLFLPPDGFSLQNYPNPFNPNTTISYQLPVSSEVELTIYNLLGQKIRTLVNTKQPAGFYQVQWNGLDDFGTEAASGIYIYRLKVEKEVQSRKMVLIR